MFRITLYEFNQLSEQEQHAMIHSRATFLEVIEEGNNRYALYGLESFFVELKYHTPSDSIKELKTFKRGRALDKYLENYKI